MDRRTAIGAGLTTLAAAGAGGLTAVVAPGDQRREHRHALEVARLEIRKTGERYKASGHSDPALLRRLASQARTFAVHHRALATRA